jgi:uncharacterized protein (DUF433 family)
MPRSPSDVLEFFELGSHSPVPVVRAHFFHDNVPQQHLDLTSDWLPSRILENLAIRLVWPWKPLLVEAELRQYRVPLNESFESAAHDYPSITINPDVMAGAPCIEGTRIPVYMVLDAVEYYGEVVAALRSYPSLTIQQVKDAIGFAKLVVECPLDDRSTPTTG